MFRPITRAPQALAQVLIVVPMQGVTNGPEPRLEDFPIDGELEPLPEFEEPQEKPLPVWEMPTLKV